LGFLFRSLGWIKKKGRRVIAPRSRETGRKEIFECQEANENAQNTFAWKDKENS